MTCYVKIFQVEANSYIVAKHGVIALTRSLGVSFDVFLWP